MCLVVKNLTKQVMSFVLFTWIYTCMPYEFELMRKIKTRAKFVYFKIINSIMKS